MESKDESLNPFPRFCNVCICRSLKTNKKNWWKVRNCEWTAKVSILNFFLKRCIGEGRETPPVWFTPQLCICDGCVSGPAAAGSTCRPSPISVETQPHGLPLLPSGIHVIGKLGPGAGDGQQPSYFALGHVCPTARPDTALKIYLRGRETACLCWFSAAPQAGARRWVFGLSVRNPATVVSQLVHLQEPGTPKP